MRSRGALIVPLVVVAALMVVAVVLWRQPTEFGWFAYEPLPAEAFQGLIFVTGGKRVAVALVALGVFVLGVLVGHAVERRSAARVLSGTAGQ